MFGFFASMCHAVARRFWPGREDSIPFRSPSGRIAFRRADGSRIKHCLHRVRYRAFRFFWLAGNRLGDVRFPPHSWDPPGRLW